MEKIIIANHKMNISTLKEIEEYQKELEPYKDKIIILPSAIYLTKFLDKNFTCGIQDISKEQIGAYTGEISALQASDLNVKYALIGHSERRFNFKETDEIINQKIKIALKHNLKVILCIGETLEQKEKGQTEEVLKNELLEDLKDINEEVIIAYEPRWAIGTNTPLDSYSLERLVTFIKKVYNYKVVYGGSINDKNIKDLKQISVLDGFLIGNASTNPVVFKKIIEEVVEI